MNSVYDNFIDNNSYGIYLFHSANNTIVYNNVTNNRYGGIILDFSNYTYVVYNQVINNNGDGVSGIASNYANISLNRIINQSVDGFFGGLSNYLWIADNRISGSSGVGQRIWNSTSISGLNNILFNNEKDLLFTSVGMDPMQSSFYNITLSNPYGTSLNNSVISFINNLSVNDSYSINWTTYYDSLPTDRVSFENKYLIIQNESLNPNIDAIAFHWSDSELTGYDESELELWKGNMSGWYLLNDTPDTTNNIITYYNLEPDFGFALLEDIS
jgi:parallel beta-helix repeat protein